MASNFINAPVDAQIEWPRKEAVITFGRWELISFPPSRDHDASLHLDLLRAGLSDVEAISVFNQLLSIASWLDDTFAVLLPGDSGSPVPCRPRRQTRRWPSSILDSWCNSWQPLKDEGALRALAIYREAVNMDDFHSVPYAVLGFYKILESAYPQGSERARNLEKEVAQLFAKKNIDERQLREIGFTPKDSPEQIAKFLKEAGRDAVAHANKEPVVNPDDARQQRRMSVAASILGEVARSCIQSRFQVGTSRWNQTWQ
jgi:hypothetical protein